MAAWACWPPWCWRRPWACLPAWVWLAAPGLLAAMAATVWMSALGLLAALATTAWMTAPGLLAAMATTVWMTALTGPGPAYRPGYGKKEKPPAPEQRWGLVVGKNYSLLSFWFFFRS